MEHVTTSHEDVLVHHRSDQQLPCGKDFGRIWNLNRCAFLNDLLFVGNNKHYLKKVPNQAYGKDHLRPAPLGIKLPVVLGKG